LYDQARTKLTKKENNKLDFFSGIFQWIEENDKTKPKKRKAFSKLTQRKTLEYQQNRCKFCGKKLKAPACDFDHIDGNKANNLSSNCQALCPNCHAKKTRRKNSVNIVSKS